MMDRNKKDLFPIEHATFNSVALKKYFDPNAKKTQQALLLLEKAQSLSKGNPIPRLDGSLAALATASAGK